MMKHHQEIGGVRKGGTYLLAGEPGIGKTTLSVQMLGDLALQGKKVLYLTNEQTQFDLLSVAKRVLGENGELPPQIKENFIIEHLVRIEDLEFWRNHLFLPDQPYSNTAVIVIDLLLLELNLTVIVWSVLIDTNTGDGTSSHRSDWFVATS